MWLTSSLVPEQKAQNNRAQRRQESVKTPSAEVTEKLENLDENFSFKDFLAGKYKS